MALSLTIQDSASLTTTGFVATVAGSGGAAVALHYTQADRPWPLDPWVAGPTRTGDGAMTVNLPKRFYFVYAATATECTPPERVAVTTGEESVAERVQSAAVALLKICTLPRIGESVFNQALLDATELRYPCAVVYLEGLAEGEDRSTNGTDDIIYPLHVLLLNTGVSRTKHTHKAWVQDCRERVGRAFRNVHLPGVPESVLVKVTGGPIVQERVTAVGLPMECYAGGFQMRVTCREPRGLGA